MTSIGVGLLAVGVTPYQRVQVSSKLLPTLMTAGVSLVLNDWQSWIDDHRIG